MVAEVLKARGGGSFLLKNVIFSEAITNKLIGSMAQYNTMYVNLIKNQIEEGCDKIDGYLTNTFPPEFSILII